MAYRVLKRDRGVEEVYGVYEDIADAYLVYDDLVQTETGMLVEEVKYGKY